MGQIRKLNQRQAPQAKLLIMPRLHDEAMHILLDAQHYFTSYGDYDQRNLHMVHKLIYSSEMTRITLRLSTVMSWLMARRAFHDGEISFQEMVDNYHLQFEDVCLADASCFDTILPSYVMHLHDESLKLYSRILVLDNIEAQTHSA